MRKNREVYRLLRRLTVMVLCLPRYTSTDVVTIANQPTPPGQREQAKA